MDPPLPYNDPYPLLEPNQPNPGSWGVVVAWTSMRLLYGTALPQLWNDLQAILDD